jgi:PPOX class probable F420-dependent enzyme
MPDRQAVAPSGLPPAIRDFLLEPRFATISTVNPDGSPHQAVVWYALDGDDLLVNSRVERRWPMNLARDPRISAAVYEMERPYHWVGLTGRAELEHEGDQATEDIMAFARRYGRNPDPYRGQNRVTYRVRLGKTYEYGADD